MDSWKELEFIVNQKTDGKTVGIRTTRQLAAVKASHRAPTISADCRRAGLRQPQRWLYLQAGSEGRFPGAGEADTQDERLAHLGGRSLDRAAGTRPPAESQLRFRGLSGVENEPEDSHRKMSERPPAREIAVQLSNLSLGLTHALQTLGSALAFARIAAALDHLTWCTQSPILMRSPATFIRPEAPWSGSLTLRHAQQPALRRWKVQRRDAGGCCVREACAASGHLSCCYIYSAPTALFPV